MSTLDTDTHRIIKRLILSLSKNKDVLSKIAAQFKAKDVIWQEAQRKTLDKPDLLEIICCFRDEKHFEDVFTILKENKSFKIVSCEDEIMRLHKGGKIAVNATISLDTINDLRMAYTPGVAQVCKRIVDDPGLIRDYTSIGNTVCIATNGSAVLGLGDIGVLAGMPVMEGKSVILNKMAGVNCIPLLIDSSDANKIVDTLEAISKTYGLIMIEDIKAPLCFEVEDRLQERVNIPVFHDDQHGTATVILAGLIKALEISGKRKEAVEIVINGAGAAGIATTKMLLEFGFKYITLCDREGAIYKDRKAGMNKYKEEIACVTNRLNEKGTIKDVIKNKDIFIGLSGPGLVTKDMVKAMKEKPIIFSLANPVPEIWPKEAIEAGACIALDGRTINNALIFPGLIKGTLESCARRINYPMKFAAAQALAGLCKKNEVVPDFMNLKVHKHVAKAVREAVKS